MKTRQVTSRVATIRLSNFVVQNKSAFENKSRDAINALIEATFPGEFFSPATVSDILAANDIKPARNGSKQPRHKTDRIRRLTRIMHLVIERLEKDLGTKLLSDDERTSLSDILAANDIKPARNGSKQPRHKTDRIRRLTRIMHLVIERLEKDLGTKLLSDDERTSLSKLNAGQTE